MLVIMYIFLNILYFALFIIIHVTALYAIYNNKQWNKWKYYYWFKIQKCLIQNSKMFDSFTFWI